MTASSHAPPDDSLSAPDDKAPLMPAKPRTAAVPSRSRQKGRPKAELRAETVEGLLDAAEELFSKRGFYGVSMKDVAIKFGVHTSLLSYYFDDKQALFDAVVRRRAPITAGRRMDALEVYEREAGDRPTVEGALKAFLDTDLDTYIEGGEAWRNYGALGAQVNNTPGWGAAVMDTLFDRVVLRLIDLLKRAMPDCPEDVIFWGYQFVTGALTLTLARTGRIDTLSNGVCRSDDFEAAREHMATFMAGGFIAACNARMAKISSEQADV